MPAKSKFMQRAIELAKLGLGKVSPNPMVGAVIVFENKIIGEGYHMEFGKAHAEVNAIQNVFENYPNAKDILKKSILYVTLEPCNHFGKTPPCSDLIIKHQIPKVIIGCIDPFPSVNGSGIKKLQDAGIEVELNLLKTESEKLNERFFTYHAKQRPFVILKWAESIDGFISKENESTLISNDSSRQLSHKWRTEEDAILVGTKTALIDNPNLTARLWKGKNPIRLVIDKDLRLPKTLHLFNSEVETIVFNNRLTEKTDNIQYIQIDFHGLVSQFILFQLYLMGIQSLIVEGGSYTINEFIKFNLWDEARVFQSKKILENGVKAPLFNREENESIQIENDILKIYKNK